MSDEVPTEPPVAGAPDPPLAWHAGTVVTDAGGAAAGPTTRAVPPGPADPTVAEPATAAFPTSPETETGPDGGDGGDGTGDDGRGSDEPAPAEKQPKSTRRVLLEWGILIAAALLIAFLIKTFLFQAFYIPSESMVPTLNVGDRVLVNKLSYDFHDVNRGDIVVFEAPPLARSADIEDLVKRVIGLPGETVEAHDDGHIYINGRLLKEPYLPKGTVSVALRQGAAELRGARRRRDGLQGPRGAHLRHGRQPAGVEGRTRLRAGQGVDDRRPRVPAHLAGRRHRLLLIAFSASGR